MDTTSNPDRLRPLEERKRQRYRDDQVLLIDIRTGMPYIGTVADYHWNYSSYCFNYSIRIWNGDRFFLQGGMRVGINEIRYKDGSTSRLEMV